MAKRTTPPSAPVSKTTRGNGGEPHQLASGDAVLTTNQGLPIADDQNMMHWFLKLSPSDEQEFEDELAECLREVQKKIWRDGGGSNRRMGTTVTMAYILWPRIFIVHAGDSRCYLLRSGELKQLTTDHTVAQQLIDAGGMTSDDAARSNWRHILWNCVGGGDHKVQPEAIRCLLKRDDVILLCSDGLTGPVEDEMIHSIIASARTSKEATERLVRAANDAGGHDNISVIVCKVQRPEHCDARDIDTDIS